jgi:hypothetical protein
LILKGRELAVGTVGFDEEFVVLLEEAGMDAVIVEACVVEVPEDSGSTGVLHGVLVLGFLPECGFGSVAIGTGFRMLCNLS